MNASVRDPRDGVPVAGLRKEDFLVYEDQVPQPVGSCLSAEAPFQLLLLLDVSASTSPFTQVLRQSALKFAAQLQPSDQIAVMTFSSGTNLILPPTNNLRRVKSAMSRVVPDGSTAFYDAVMSALALMGELPGRKAIVVFSDGVDNQLLNPQDGSENTFTQLLEAARQSSCLIYTISLLPEKQEEASHAVMMTAENQMQTLARDTGGRMYKLRNPGELFACYTEIAHDLRFIYTLAYAPNPAAASGWRELKVGVRGRPELTVHARPGYFKKQESEVRSQKAE